MEHRTLGGSGLGVSPVCLGTTNFGPERTEQERHRIMDAALDAIWPGPGPAREVYAW